MRMWKRRIIAPVLILLLGVSQSACFGLFGGDTPTEKFARDNKAFQIALQEADKTINTMLDAQPPLLKPAQVVTLYERGLIPVNNFHRAFLLEVIGYLEGDGSGREKLVLNADRRQRLEQLLASLMRLSQEALNSFASDLPGDAKAKIMLAIGGLVPLVIRMQTLLAQAKFKETKDTPVSLRALARAPTTQISYLPDGGIRLTLPDQMQVDRLATGDIVIRSQALFSELRAAAGQAQALTDALQSTQTLAEVR